MKIKGKNGQERKDGKKTGGVMFNLNITEEEIKNLFFGFVRPKADGTGDEFVKGIFTENPGKVAQAMFAYGMTSQVQEEIGYTIPGAEAWKEEGEAKEHQWTAQDTEEYLEALATYNALPTQRTGLTLEARQEAWDKKKAFLDKSQEALPEEFRMDAATIASILGKRPEKK